MWVTGWPWASSRERPFKADLSHSALAVIVTTAIKTGHPTDNDFYGRCSAETGHSEFSVGKPPINDRFGAG